MALRRPDEPSDDELRELLASSPVIAVLGVHHDAERAASYVPAYLAEHGHQIHGVTPALVGRELFGRPVVASLAAVTARGVRIDMVDVFRRPDALPGHLAELLAAKPRIVWFQQGIRHDAVAAELRAAGIAVVQDRCTYADHRRLRVQLRA